MKKIAITLGVLAAVPLLVLAQSILKVGQWVVINTSTSSPLPLTNIAMNVNSLTLFGKKGYQTTNTTAIYVGFSATDGAQGVSIDPGGWAIIKDAKGGRLISVSNIWLDVSTANDGVVVFYD